MNTTIAHTENQKTERRSSGFNFFKFDTSVEIIYEPELCKQHDMTAYYESFQEIAIKRGGLIMSVSIADMPEEERNNLRCLMKAIADLSTGNLQ